MDVKSLYTTIPNKDGLLALTHFLNKRPVPQPPTHTLVHLAELVLILNTFSFNGKYYSQTGGVAMGSRLEPNYASVHGPLQETNLWSVHKTNSDLYKRHIDDIAEDFSGREKKSKILLSL